MQPGKLLNKHFVLLFQGQLVSQMGSSVYLIALIFWVKHATDSATLMGLLAMVSTIPGILRGKPNALVQPDNGYCSANSEKVELRLDCGFTIDGEMTSTVPAAVEA